LLVGLLVGAEGHAFKIGFDNGLTDTFDIRQGFQRFEWSMLAPVLHDRLSPARPYTFQCRRQCFGIGGIDVYLAGGKSPTADSVNSKAPRIFTSPFTFMVYPP
jgi:hypothetical protein